MLDRPCLLLLTVTLLPHMLAAHPSASSPPYCYLGHNATPLSTCPLPPGAMDMALGLRTMVIPDAAEDTLYRCGRALLFQ